MSETKPGGHGLPVEFNRNRAESQFFTEAEIEAYRDGCEEVALKLSDAVGNILKAGKKPTILIPSRGAVPIFLNALDYLRKEHDPIPLADSNKSYFYPDKIFQYLAPEVTKPGNPTDEPQEHVDVVLFPFTADVSVIDIDKNVSQVLDQKQLNENAEKLAEQLRRSCAASIVNLLYGDHSSLDLKWHYFLLGKLNPSVFSTFGSSAQEIIDNLESVEPDPDREIILIDTVLSGRAVSNISQAFHDLGHPVTPILAVDSKDGRLKSRYASIIRRNVNMDYIRDVDEQFTKFPLITEDRGPALLGVSALNIVNFNNPERFKAKKGEEREFPEGFLPQSCLWLVPSEDGNSHGLNYIDVFHGFMRQCMNGYNSEDSEPVQRELRHLLGKTGSKLVEFSDDVLPGLRTSPIRTSSGIVSAYIDQKEAQKWVDEFRKKYVK
nr:hypothetical protein [Candidatus Levybacteria bacterium]